MARIFLGLGSNLTDRIINITKAINLFNENNIKITRVSPIYETLPSNKVSLLGFVCPFYLKQPDYLNCVVEAFTDDDPNELLVKILKIEKLLKRKRIIATRNLPRTIDIDILFYNDMIINQAMLKIPHPKLHNRAFVLVPFADLEPDFVHPQFNKTIQELLKSVDKKGVTLWKKFDSKILV